MFSNQAVLTGLKTIQIRKRKVPPPARHEVQLDIQAVGICGSDMAYWGKGVAGGFVPLDFSAKGLSEGYCGQLGHECAGTVRVVGSDVKHLKVGDRVAMEPGVPCSNCDFCRRGRYNLCPKMSFIGSGVNKVPGAMGTLFNHSAAYCHKLPSHVSVEEGAMFEPMCVALHAVQRARVSMGKNVLVTGAGPIGLLVALCAKAAGASSVTITDISQSKLDKASEIGIDYPLMANTPDLLAVMESKLGSKFDVCFECSGVVACLDLCVQGAISGGVVCVVANMKEQRTPARLQEAARREIDVVGCYRYCNLYPTALALVASGKVNLKPLISKQFPLSQANQAFEHFASGQAIKVMIKPNM